VDPGVLARLVDVEGVMRVLIVDTLKP